LPKTVRPTEDGCFKNSFLGYETGVILESVHDFQEKKKAYNADITYGTNNEFGFDTCVII